MNLLTFDIEEWYVYKRTPEKHIEFDQYLDAILKKLDERQQKSTFFCIGEMGRLFPEVIRKIQAQGHEIGCHSNTHTWLNKMTEVECREDTHRAVDSLEQCVGKKVKSYRAPAFSIGENNKWAFEILAENGIERDASVFPARRDFGGFPEFGQQRPSIIKYKGITLKEFPVAMSIFLGKQVAYSGGGYFRFFPLGFVKSRMAKADYSMCYFHIGDLLPEMEGVPSRKQYENYYKEPGSLKNRYVRYVKTNLGKKNAFGKMMKIIDVIDFMGLQKADDSIDWNAAPVVKL